LQFWPKDCCQHLFKAFANATTMGPKTMKCKKASSASTIRKPATPGPMKKTRQSGPTGWVKTNEKNGHKKYLEGWAAGYKAGLKYEEANWAKKIKCLVAELNS
jgi:hypothetical protein